MVDSLVDSLPVGTAYLSVESDEEIGGSEITISVWPIKRKAAPIVIHVEQKEITAILGKRVTFEWIARGSNDRARKVLRDLQAVCEAALHGRIRERVWLYKGEVALSHGELQLNGDSIRTTFRQVIRSLLARERAVFDYEPY